MRLTKPTVKLWKIERLAEHPSNYRHHPQAQIDVIKASLARFGWGKVSISGRPSDGLLWTGHGVAEACRQLGLSQVPVSERELSDVEGLAWLAADNESSRDALVVDDGAALAAILGKLALESVEGLAGTGHDADSLEALLAELEDGDTLADLVGDATDDDAATRAAPVEPTRLPPADNGATLDQVTHVPPAAGTELAPPAPTIEAIPDLIELTPGLAALELLGYLNGSKTVFDYGCGDGADLAGLQSRGVTASGWDPVWADQAETKNADLVNMACVVSAIADTGERGAALIAAFDLADELLIVSVPTGKPPADYTASGDGVVSPAGEFSKHYSQPAIAAYVAAQIGDMAEGLVSQPGGIVIAFKTAAGLADFQRRQADAAPAFADDPALALVDQWGVRSGQIWALGKHRLYVGDILPDGVAARLIELERLGPVDAVITDPPFAIYGSSTGIGADIADDRMVRPFFERALGVMRDACKWFGHVNISCDWRSWGGIWESARRVRLAPANCLVWDKGNGGLGSMYSNCHELIGFFIKTPPPSAMRSTSARGHRMVYKPNILRHNRAHGAERLHNAAKPLALLAELIEASTEAGERVFDPFCGSGSTLIACERAGRICYTSDAEPRWAATAIQRYASETGNTPAVVAS